MTRQESLFMADSKSSPGALGVMQIMPDTGRWIASVLGENFSDPSFLLLPENNIRFGTCYLRMCLKELQNNPVLASAAYNAGPRMVRSWLPEEGSISTDIWLKLSHFLKPGITLKRSSLTGPFIARDWGLNRKGFRT